MNRLRTHVLPLGEPSRSTYGGTRAAAEPPYRPAVDHPTAQGPVGWGDAARRCPARAVAVAEVGVRALVAALVTTFAEPTPSSPALRRRLWLPLGGRRDVDLVALANLVLAVALFIGIAAFLNTLNDARGDPLADPTILLLAASSALPVLVRSRWPLAAWRVSLLAVPARCSPAGPRPSRSCWRRASPRPT